jgi:CubicO group peptidase (beta-lactamase class C family)
MRNSATTLVPVYEKRYTSFMLSRCSLFVLLAGSCLAQDAARMDQVVQSYVANHQFMGTALVARGGQVLYSKAFGSADLEWDIPNAPNTKFRLGSVTKQFTAASILLLEERGKLKVTDPVKKYMPDAPAAWDKITIFNVLTHTSGIPNFTSFPDYAKFGPFPTTPTELVGRFRDKPLDFEPGEKWNYSNSGYVLLTYLIEKITGDTYEKFVHDNIFSPLGMKDSGYDSNSAVIPHRASGYVSGPKGFENAGFVHMTVPQGAGALYSTTEDLLKWEQGLFGGKVLQAASLEKMTTPFKNNYAFGLGVSTESGHKLISHGGGIQGFNTELEYYPEDKLTVVVLSNVNGAAPGEIAKKLAALAHGDAVKLQSERKETTLDPKVLTRYVGAYQMDQGPVNLITLEGNQLFTKLGNQPPSPIFAESENMFFLKVVEAQVEFTGNDAQGRPTQLTIHQNGRDIPGKRLDDAESKKLTDAAAAVAKRFKDQTAAPGSEAALRKMIEDCQAGKPDYDSMSTGLANATRQQLTQLQAAFTEHGKIQSMTFTGVGPAGPDIYQVKFEKGTLEYRIWLAPDGKVDSANFRPAQ